MNKTDFFVLGFPKCGTTSLYEYLKSHPQIFLPAIKEPHFFSEDMPVFREIFTQEQYDQMYLGKKEGQLSGDFSIFSLYSKVALEKIHAYQPQAKIIAMLRNPVDMFHSIHSQMLYTFYENEKDCETAWVLQQARKENPELTKFFRQPSVLQYKDVCNVGSQLKRVCNKWVVIPCS